MTALDGTEPFPRAVVARVRELVPCANVVYFEDSPTRSVVVGAGALSIPAAVLEAAAAYGDERPTAASRLTPADGVVKLSDRVSRRELGRLHFYQEAMRPIGIEDELALALPVARPGTAGFSLIRGEAFTDRDRATFALLAPYLTAAHERLRRATAARADVDLTEREWEVMTCVAQGKTNKEVAALLAMSPETVRKHLENVFAKLGVHTRTAAVARAFRNPSG